MQWPPPTPHPHTHTPYFTRPCSLFCLPSSLCLSLCVAYVEDPWMIETVTLIKYAANFAIENHMLWLLQTLLLAWVVVKHYWDARGKQAIVSWSRSDTGDVCQPEDNSGSQQHPTYNIHHQREGTPTMPNPHPDIRPVHVLCLRTLMWPACWGKSSSSNWHCRQDLNERGEPHYTSWVYIEMVRYLLTTKYNL